MQGGANDGHALVVGCPGKNLKGVEHGVRGMADMLRARGFTVDVRTGDRATRAGVLAGYDELIASARASCPAVFYYTGHGFYSPGPTESTRCQGICPTDVADSTRDDFRGITAWELSLKLAELTRRTKNATVILDCCYASQMSRDAAARSAVPRTLPHPLRAGVEAHLRALRAKYGAAFDAVDPLGNRDAVRVVACGQGETAFEYENERGEHRGAFTEALLQVLDEVGDAPVAWAAIESAIRARVFDRFPGQRPCIEGPAKRRLFSLDEDDVTGNPVIFAVGSGFEIGAGRLAGVAPGDVYGVMPSGSRTYRVEDAIAEVKVEEPSATVSQAVLQCWKNGHAELPQAAIAFPIQRAIVQHAVEIDVPDAERQRVEAELARSGTLRVGDAEEATPLATLRLLDRLLTIEDRLGPLFPATRFPEDLQDTVANLANLGAAQRLRALEGEHGVSADEVDIEWGTVDRDELRPMPERGGGLALGDRIYVRVRSKAQRQLYVHIFNIGLRGTITLLTQNIAAAGVPLRDQASEFVLGNDGHGTRRGLSLHWPPGMPRALPRIDEIVVIASSMPTGLLHLQTRERLVGSRSAQPQLRSGMEAIDGFFLKRLSYLLHPREAAMADIRFEIDDNPLRQAGALAPEAWIVPRAGASPPATPATTMTIRLADLVVMSCGTVFPALRLDALICTRSADEVRRYTTWTQRYRAVEDAEYLVGDAAVVFHGPVQDFVDICLWASCDAEGSPDLAHLLARRTPSSELRDAVGALAMTDVTSAAATGGSAVLSRMAHEVLTDAAGTSIALYRTSLPADPRSDRGCRPGKAVHCTRAMLFSLVIGSVESPGDARIGN